MSLQPPDRVEHYQIRVIVRGDGWLLPPNPPENYGVTDPDDQKWMNDYCTPHPFKTFQQTISLTHRHSVPYPRTYIWASEFKYSPFVKFAEKYRDDPAWGYREIPACHMVMLSHANELTTMLIELAGL